MVTIAVKGVTFIICLQAIFSLIFLGVDPGFFRQMEELKSQATSAYKCVESKKCPLFSSSKIPSSATYCVPQPSAIICAGLACVDMQLGDATGGEGGESIDTFEGVTYIGGGR